jgi:hypothetical protein
MRGLVMDMAGIYHDLGRGNLRTRATLNLDAMRLGVDDFASRYGPAIRMYYSKSGYGLDHFEGYELASRLWCWLKEL